MKQTSYLKGEILKAALRTSTVTARANTTAYALGDRVMLGTADLNVYECVVAGTSAGVPPAFNTNIGDTTVDGGVTWLTLKQGLPKRPNYVALFTVAPTDAAAGTEVVGGSYARQVYQPSDANWTPATSAGDASNKVAVTFPAPTANWGDVVAFGVLDRLTGGNLLWWGELTQSLPVNNGDVAPSFAIASVHVLDGQHRNPGLRVTVP